MNYSTLSPIEEIIQDARNGKIFIMIDDEDRENEGDFIVSAELVTAEQIAQIINYSSGIICLVIEEERRRKLGLELARRRGDTANRPVFLDSIEASSGVSTGVSATDRLQTIKAAINPNANYDSIITPGHIFPLLAHPMGLKGRQGHTETSIAIMKLAGLDESAILCEAVNKDGTMARLPELLRFAKELNIKVGSVADLIRYIDENKKEFYTNNAFVHKENPNLVEKVS